MITKLADLFRRRPPDPLAGVPVRRSEPIDVTPPAQPTPPRGRATSPPERVVPDTLVPGGILGPGGPAGIPTIPAVTMPEVRWTEPIPAGLRFVWRLRSDNGRLRRAGRAGAESEHHGDPVIEAGIAHLYSGLRFTLASVLRSDPELLGADHFHRSWEIEVERRDADHARAEEQHQPTIDAAGDVAATTEDDDEQNRWSAARNAQAVVKAHQARAEEGRQHLDEATQYREIAGRRALERLDLVARAGVDRINLYRTAFNRERTGRPGLDPLPEDLVATLIAQTVQPILAAADDDLGEPPEPMAEPVPAA